MTSSYDIWGETSEKTPVYASNVVVTYQVSSERSAWLYANVTNVNELVDNSLLSSAVKSAMVKLPAENVTNRSAIEPLVQEYLQASIDNKYGSGTVTILKVVINQMDFEESYNEAIAARSIARQNYEKQLIENETSEEECKCSQIINHVDPDVLRQRATPRTRTIMSDAKIARINAMKASGYTNAEIASALNISASTVSKYL